MSYTTIHPPDDLPPSTFAEPVPSGAVHRAVRLLEAIVTTNGLLGVRALARATGIDKSAVSRLLHQLAEGGMVQPADVSGRYRIGPRLYALAAAVASRDNMWEMARPILDDLVGKFDETCYLAVRDGDEVVFRDKVECLRPVRYVIELGVPAPLHAGAAGRAILAGLTPDDLDAFIGRAELDAVTEHTVTDRDVLRRLIEADRARGYSVSLGERSAGGAGVAAPFFAATGRCAGSLVITMPIMRLDRRRIPVYGQAVMAAASALSALMGYSNRPPAATR